MSSFSKDDIIEKATELAKKIAETDEVDFYRRAEIQINENKKVRELIDRIKRLQKQAVNYQHYGKIEALKVVEEKIDQLQAELDEIPVVQEFKQSQVDVNDLLQIVANTISNKVTEELTNDVENISRSNK
ncbi:RicAFT regulatory complex protein RicA family protein [Heyndrickxia ginsengihumi]|uniref:Cell fate regulator YmcA, YheA/YmcA/DUF963 family (Controls sporulation, competence, biofilm development) n=1 Tax=Heyndrickxia ginsengihumi TaxID=363870 RepID=A0A0A6VIW1_9BACI|nr:RicAFT regulatory complex protein RicA family protein [Heyndrickxia ginsengihumi]KHD86569.1 hypothetical protein NG54_02715 [Heyndrickxia ginsengihumi]MBE6182832.1 hypothetical protein [Bacillus sp. (in: firmicutes)]NEY21197.1 hypothetical protein [Heyndrickxia ginsengihumi]